MVTLTRLRLVRQRKALTQQQLAQKAGVNRATIARLEGGIDEPLPTTVRKLASGLGVDPEELMEPLIPFDAGSRPAPQPAAGILLGTEFAEPGAENVRRLLWKMPDLATLVREAAGQLIRFIPDARLRLEALSDPEFGDSEELFLGVITSLPEGEALNALDRFDEAWWLHNVGRAGGLLCINLAYE